jgi:hypothetical protein
VLFGRSRTCPTDAFTTKRGGKNFLIVRAFVGDSTMMSGFFNLFPVLRNPEPRRMIKRP